jgi:predicted nucleic acid-binding protein
MRIVLDACVVIASIRPSEPSHSASKARVQRVLRGDDEIVVPSFFIVETSGALARLGQPEADILPFIDALTAPPHEIVTVGPKSARAARTVALMAKLRGPDALYVWVAARAGLPLCTLDQEIVSRAGPHCQVIAP